jgi:carbonic anhydrase
MACKHNRAPIDINRYITNKHCEGKCAYQFQYSPSQAILTNMDTYLSLGNYNVNTSDKVIYNNIKVDDHINPYIFAPSVHTFNGTNTDAELVIVHKGNGAMVVVCIPINGLGSSNTSLSKVISQENLDKIIYKNDNVLPSGVEYNLSESIKLGVPYFSYSSNLFFGDCEKCDYIVYTEPIIISSSSISSLKNILNPHKINICTISCPLLYYNKTGATDGTSSDEIYIECQPTDHSGKEIPVPTKPTLPNIDKLIGIKLDIPTEHLIIGAISGILIIVLIIRILRRVKTPSK